MNSISQKKSDVNTYYVDGADITRRRSAAEPIATPMADFLAASYGAGMTDAAGADAEMMDFDGWRQLHTWEFRPIYFDTAA